MFLLGLQAAAWRVPFLPTRAGLGSDVHDALNPTCARSRSPYRAERRGEELVAVPALELDVALIHHAPRRRSAATASSSASDPYFDDLMVHGGRSAAS